MFLDIVSHIVGAARPACASCWRMPATHAASLRTTRIF